MIMTLMSMKVKRRFLLMGKMAKKYISNERYVGLELIRESDHTGTGNHNYTYEQGIILAFLFTPRYLVWMLLVDVVVVYQYIVR